MNEKLLDVDEHTFHIIQLEGVWYLLIWTEQPVVVKAVLNNE